MANRPIGLFLHCEGNQSYESSAHPAADHRAGCPDLQQEGVAGTSIDDVLKAAKVAKGCLYGHFENKEALSQAAVDYMLEKVLDRRSAMLAAESTSKGKLIAFMDYHKNPLASFLRVAVRY